MGELHLPANNPVRSRSGKSRLYLPLRMLTKLLRRGWACMRPGDGYRHASSARPGRPVCAARANDPAADRGGDVGRGRFLGRGRAGRAQRRRGDRDHAATVRSRRGERAQRGMLRWRRYPRCAQRGGPAGHRALCLRSRQQLSPKCGRAVCRRLSGRPHADPVHSLQHGAQVHRSAGDGARTGCRLPGDRALRAPRDGRGRAGTAPGARPRARPELFPLRHHAGPARLPAVSAGRHAQTRGTRDCRGRGPAGGGQARQPGHLLRARR